VMAGAYTRVVRKMPSVTNAEELARRLLEPLASRWAHVYKLTVEPPAPKMRDNGPGGLMPVTDRQGVTQFVVSLRVQPGDGAPKGEEIRVTLQRIPGGVRGGHPRRADRRRVERHQTGTEDDRSISGISFKAMGLKPVGGPAGREVNTAGLVTDVIIHVYPGAVGWVTVHPDDGRVVLRLARARPVRGLALFLDRVALSNLHALTGSALTELAKAVDEKAAAAVENETAAESAA